MMNPELYSEAVDRLAEIDSHLAVLEDILPDELQNRLNNIVKKHTSLQEALCLYGKKNM